MLIISNTNHHYYSALKNLQATLVSLIYFTSGKKYKFVKLTMMQKHLIWSRQISALYGKSEYQLYSSLILQTKNE